MAGKPKSLSDVLPMIVKKASTEARGGILDEIPAHGLGKRLDPKTEIDNGRVLIERPIRRGPRQVNGRWCREDGTPFSTEEILRGKHLERS
jgi:hypothetical protein